jgi:hypothetical protein
LAPFGGERGEGRRIHAVSSSIQPANLRSEESILLNAPSKLKHKTGAHTKSVLIPAAEPQILEWTHGSMYLDQPNESRGPNTVMDVALSLLCFEG